MPFWDCFFKSSSSSSAGLRLVGSPPTIEGDGEFDTEAVGESNYQEALWAAVRNEPPGERGYRAHVTAQLVPEPSNPYDRNAIRVEIGGRLVGYLSREEAIEFAALVDTAIRGRGAARCAALICGGFAVSGGRASLGVWLDLEVGKNEVDAARRYTGRSSVSADAPPKYGLVKGKHYTEYVEDVKALKRHEAYDAALELLGDLIDAVEEEARETGVGVASWYYEQYAIVCRKERNFLAEIQIVERYATQPHGDAGPRPELLARVEKARERLTRA